MLEWKDRSEFIFTLCQAGAEPALKEEFARENPELRFAYSRPGFVTFKASDNLDSAFELASVFARAYGISLGKINRPKEAPVDLAGMARELAELATVARGSGTSLLRLHVTERERFTPGEEPQGYVYGELTRAALAAITETESRLGERLFHRGEVAVSGDEVLDVVIVEEQEWWIGRHRHSPGHSPYPGGRPRVTLPPEAPSRAYLKIEEAILGSGAPVREDDVAVEIGSAPGGACYALLKRGLEVVGIDSAQMDPVVTQMPGFRRLAMSAAQVEPFHLPQEVEWLLLDMNALPVIALREAERIASWFPESLLGVFFTIKLNEWKLARDIPSLIARVRKMKPSLSRVRAVQLPSHRQEILVYGLTRKGQSRLAGKSQSVQAN